MKKTNLLIALVLAAPVLGVGCKNQSKNFKEVEHKTVVETQEAVAEVTDLQRAQKALAALNFELIEKEELEARMAELIQRRDEIVDGMRDGMGAPTSQITDLNLEIEALSTELQAKNEVIIARKDAYDVLVEQLSGEQKDELIADLEALESAVEDIEGSREEVEAKYEATQLVREYFQVEIDGLDRLILEKETMVQDILNVGAPAEAGELRELAAQIDELKAKRAEMLEKLAVMLALEDLTRKDVE